MSQQAETGEAPAAVKRRALVIGGNFGGLAAGIAAQRSGFETTVFERAPQIEDLQRAKGGLHLWPNAMRALEILGADGPVRRDGIAFSAWETYTNDGKLRSVWPLQQLEQELGYPTLLSQRRDLHQALLSTFRDAGGEVRGGSACTGFTQENGGVTARFDGGAEERGELLVGADGLNSAIRKQLHGLDEPRPGGVLMRGGSTLSGGTIPPGVLRTFYGTGTQLAIAQLDDETAVWFLRSVTLAMEQTKDLEAVRRLVRGWADPVPRVVDATDPDTIASAENFDREPLDRWGEGRVTLVGDAAHPMLNTLSQGAAQSLEDGAVLKRVFEEKGTADVEGALRAYEERRQKRSAGFVKRSRMIGNIGLWKNPALLAVRNRIILSSNIAWKKTAESVSERF